jgi:hypothetical protein
MYNEAKSAIKLVINVRICPVKKRGGVHEWYQSIGLAFVYHSAIFIISLIRDPGSLNIKKRF